MEWIFQNKFVRNANFSPALVLGVLSVRLSFPPPGSDSDSQTVGSLDPLVPHVRNMSACITRLRASKMRACSNASQKKKKRKKSDSPSCVSF